MADVFLSYATEDRPRAGLIAKALEAGGWLVWWDRNIPAGKRFVEVIEEEIGRARSVIVLWSAVSVKKDWVIEEAEEGKRRGILVPVFIEAVQPPWGFRQIQAADLSGWRGDPKGTEFLALCRALATVVSPASRAGRSRLPDDDPSLENAGRSYTPSVTPVQVGNSLKLGKAKVSLTITGHRDSINSVAWSPDGKRLATGSADGTARVWEAETGREMLTLPGKGDAIRTVAWNWSPDEPWLAVANQGDRLTIWDSRSGEELLDEPQFGFRVAWRPCGSWLAATNGNSIVVRDLTTGANLPIRYDGSALSLAWSHDGTRLATGGGEGDQLTRVWEAETGKELLSLNGHEGGIYGLAWSPDRRLLASASNDGTVKVWNATKGGQVLMLRLAPAGGWNECWSVDWSPCGKWLATGSQDGVVRVWDAESGDELLTLNGHSGSVTSVAWHPVGTLLATGSEDNTAKIWDVGT